MRRKIGLCLVFGAALPLAVVSVAWACGVLATLKLDKKVAAPGDTITATGRNWATTGHSAVSLRLKTRDGRVIATTAAQPGGTISETFALPRDLDPGWYVVLATQTNTTTGNPKTGTPGRTTLRIQGSAGAQAVAAPAGANPSGPAVTAGGSGQSLLALLLAGGISIAMLAGGWVLLSRRSRSVGEPQFSI
jgi:hypothetical protein